MKWLTVMSCLNGGLVLICFGQMARVNQCGPRLEESFFIGGGFGIAVAALIAFASAFMVIVEFVQKRQKDRRAYVQAPKH